MVVICFTLASVRERMDGRPVEHLRTYCHYVDGDREETQGTIRDNNRAAEIVGLVLKASPLVVDGAPPAGSNPVISCYVAVARSRGPKASHALSYERHDFSARYNSAVSSFMENCVGGWRRMLERACRERDRANAAKGSGRLADTNETKGEMR